MSGCGIDGHHHEGPCGGIGEGFAFFHWNRFNYELFAQWHRGRDLIWLAWWNVHRGAHVK